MNAPSSTARQGDRLLWLLGGSLGVVAVLSFVLLNFGTDGGEAQPPAAPVGTQTEAALHGAQIPPPDEPARDVYAVRLNRAQLALDAGMLIEPEGFSAWSLFASVLAEDPGNGDAQQGLEAVASALVDDALAASTEGRADAAEGMLAIVLDRYPEHADAARLLERLRAPARTETPPPSAPTRAPVRDAASTTTVAAPQSRPPAVAVSVPRANPVAEVYPRFTRALASGSLVEPADASAEHFLGEMRRLDATHAMTLDSEQQLLDAVLDRFAAAFDSLDTQAAQSWLDAAEQLSIDPERVGAARRELTQFIDTVAAAENIAASELTMREYAPPVYPALAVRRGAEGWVDVEFLVDRDGLPREVTVVDASHDNLFRDEAVAAVAAWRFEPQRIMGRVVEQRAHTRIRFAFER